MHKLKQELSVIQEIPLKLPKNAKLFFHNEKGLYFLVHYDHVILTLANTVRKRILSAYVGSPTSQSAIEQTLHVYEIEGIEGYYCVDQIYKLLGKTKEQLKSDRGDYKRSNTGIGWKPKMVKAEWRERISALENYDYTKGAYLWQ